MDKTIILDTDMVSVFAKIKRLELLKRLFSKHHIVITPEVYKELTISLEYGYIFPLDIFRYLEVLPPLEEEREAWRSDRELRHGC